VTQTQATSDQQESSYVGNKGVFIRGRNGEIRLNVDMTKLSLDKPRTLHYKPDDDTQGGFYTDF